LQLLNGRVCSQAEGWFKRGPLGRPITAAASMVGPDVVRICVAVITQELPRVAQRYTVAPEVGPVRLVRRRVRIGRALLAAALHFTRVDRGTLMRDAGL
jgi:hypothetical protein